MPRLADRVKETSTTTGTGTFTLAGAATGFRSFASVFSDADPVFYVIVAVNSSGVPTGAWEVGIGTVGGSGTTLARTTVYSSSNSGSLVNFGAGTKQVFVDRPTRGARRVANDDPILENADGDVVLSMGANGDLILTTTLKGGEDESADAPAGEIRVSGRGWEFTAGGAEWVGPDVLRTGASIDLAPAANEPSEVAGGGDAIIQAGSTPGQGTGAQLLLEGGKDRGTDGAARFNAPVVMASNGRAATMTTAFADPNANLTYTASVVGPAGNVYSVQYFDPGGNNEPLTFEDDGNTLRVFLATGPAGALVTTAQDIIDNFTTTLGIDPPENVGDGTGVVGTADASLDLGLSGLTIAGPSYFAGAGEFLVALVAPEVDSPPFDGTIASSSAQISFAGGSAGSTYAAAFLLATLADDSALGEVAAGLYNVDGNDAAPTGIGLWPEVLFGTVVDALLGIPGKGWDIAHVNAIQAWSADPDADVSVAAKGAGVISLDSPVLATALPTADPVVAGALWNDGGAVMVSAG